MKVICVGRNYVDHAAELRNPVPESPLLFMKPSTALLLDAKPFYHPEHSDNIHYEVEILVKIKKNGKHIDQKFATNYYDEIGLGIDFTARDTQDKLKNAGHPWELAKAFDHSAVIGKFVPKSTLNLENIQFDLAKNNEIVQVGQTKDLIFSIDYLITYMSKFFTLQQGDIIFTGTPAGVGKVSIGDNYVGRIEGIKVLECSIK
jgi:2-keto-4-pentenoate hydratase/2-oxohepta-3-ene-1,7-dioic acid hydratase in catechol pathway